jgi:hypothetical protein
MLDKVKRDMIDWMSCCAKASYQNEGKQKSKNFLKKVVKNA